MGLFMLVQEGMPLNEDTHLHYFFFRFWFSSKDMWSAKQKLHLFLVGPININPSTFCSYTVNQDIFLSQNWQMPLDTGTNQYDKLGDCVKWRFMQYCVFIKNKLINTAAEVFTHSVDYLISVFPGHMGRG